MFGLFKREEKFVSDFPPSPHSDLSLTANPHHPYQHSSEFQNVDFSVSVAHYVLCRWMMASLRTVSPTFCCFCNKIETSLTKFVWGRNAAEEEGDMLKAQLQHQDKDDFRLFAIKLYVYTTLAFRVPRDGG